MEMMTLLNGVVGSLTVIGGLTLLTWIKERQASKRRESWVEDITLSHQR